MPPGGAFALRAGTAGERGRTQTALGALAAGQ